MKKRPSSLLGFLVLLCSCSEVRKEQFAKIDSLEKVYDGKLVQIQINDSVGVSDKIKDGQWVLLEDFDLPWDMYAHMDNPPTPDLLKVQTDIKGNNQTYFIHYSHIKEFNSVKSSKAFQP